MPDERFEKLKSALFSAGHDALSEFLAYDFDPYEDKDATDSRLDEVYQQMPEEELEKFYQTYGI